MRNLLYPISICALLSGVSVSAALAANEYFPDIEQITGVFDDGQQWQISVPPDWNGVVVNALDSVGYVEYGRPEAVYFLGHGFAYTGTSRHPDRSYNWDPAAEARNMARVLELFEENFGEPTHAIQFGCSGGGSVGLSLAEDYPDRFDGVISMHASSPIEMANMRLDLSVALKALLDPDDELPLIIEASQADEARAVWLAALEEAMATEEGRARMALAGAVSQFPMWGRQDNEADKPDWNDPQSVQDAMVLTVIDGALRGVAGRPQWDSPAGLVSWTVDIDYHAFYDNADPTQRELVSQMYHQAGLDAETDLRADIDRINALPRIIATESGVEYFRERSHTGNIGIPVLHVSAIGDSTTPAAVMAGYEAKIDREGTGSLYRQAFIDAAGHCTFNEPEMAALVETMIERIDTGEWGNTDAEALNAAGEDSGLGEARFIDLDENTGFRLPNSFNRIFFQDDDVPGLESPQ